MSSLYTWRNDHFFFYVPRITADLFNYPVQTVVIPKDDERNKDKEWVAKKAHGHFPVFENAEGEVIYESSAIAAYIARVSGNEDFLGKTAWERAQVDQFVSIANSSVWPQNSQVIYTIFGFKNDIAAHDEGLKNLKKVVEQLESHLQGKDWFVGDRLTIADINLFLALAPGFTLVLDAAYRETVPSVNAWWQKISQLPAVAGVTGFLKPAEQAIKPVAQ